MTKNILIIGAGMAGIMAGKTLVDAGYDVTLLEARERIGGRTHTDHSLGMSVDLGAAWIHGPIGNPLTPLKTQFGVIGADNDLAERDEASTLAFDFDGTPIDMGTFRLAQQQAQAELVRQTGSQLTPPLPDTLQSMQALADYCRNTIGELTAVQEKAFRYSLLMSPSNWEAADPEQIDWASSDDYLDYPGGDLLLHGGGYGKIIHGLAEGLPIKTGVVVTHINYDEEGVTVQTNSGKFAADRAIITMPLGVLKSADIHFAPPLPKTKRSAIERIGFGTAEKLALLFDDFYWPKEKEHFIYFDKNGRTHYSSWNNIGKHANLPILISYKTGSDTADFNQWSDEEAVDNAMMVLRNMFEELPPPLKFVRTQWQIDPFSKGSYSFNKVGQRPEDRRELGKPVENRLFFAGEATHTAYWGTVHAAYETGVRAAREIIAIDKAG